MTEPRSHPSVRRPQTPRKKKSPPGRILWLVLLAAVALGAWWFLRGTGDEGADEFAAVEHVDDDSALLQRF